MPMRTTAEQSEALLSRRVAEARRSGAMSPDAEALALFESIALNLLLNPRTAQLFTLYARNGLRRATLDELASIESIKSAIDDLSNTSLSVNTTKQLDAARIALIQLEQLDKISSTSNQFKKFDSSVSEFLNKVVSKSVRRPGASSLTRPGTEASDDLQTEMETLTDLHTDLLDRLYSIVVGVDNFLTSPLSTIIGLTTAARARADIESLIASIDASGSMPANRDMVVRLITDRAAVRVIGDLPKIGDPLLSTTQSLPTGYSLSGVSDEAPAIVVSDDGPFPLPVSAAVGMTVGSSVIAPVSFPQTTFDLQNRAALVSDTLTFPLNVPANYYLFVVLDSTSHRIGPFTAGGAVSKASFFADAAAQIAASTAAGLLTMGEYIQTGTDRLILTATSASQMQIVSQYVGTFSELIGGSTPSTPTPGIYSNSLHTLLKFDLGAVARNGSTPTIFIVEAINRLFGSLVTAAQTDTGFEIRTVQTSVGTSISITAPAVLGISGVTSAVSDQVRLTGTVAGVPTQEANPIGLMDINDIINLPSGSQTVAGLSSIRITLSSAVPTFSGPIEVQSAMVLAYTRFSSLIEPFLSKWLSADFVEGLERVRLASVTLRANTPLSQRNLILEELEKLRQLLQELLTLLDDSQSVLLSSSASKERVIAAGILTSLEERKFDRAVDLMMRAKIQEALDSTMDSASFGGNLLKAASDFARADMVVPNRALDEDVESESTQEIKGL